MELSKDEFEVLRNYIHSICGIFICDEKAYLVQQRLEPIALSYGCKSFVEFYQHIRKSKLPIFQEQLISAITTNETSFFRDGHPFNAFKEYILPRSSPVIRARKFRDHPRKGAKVRLWSAGASTGQEAYSIAIIVDEYADSHKHSHISVEDFGIIASDVSYEVLSKAMKGIYTQKEIERGISSEHLEKYFTKSENNIKNWIINSSIRSMIEFRQINLIHPFTTLGGFDVIFCRNVLIYFDSDTRFRIIDQFHNMLSDKGFLILGATESVYPLTNKFDSIHYGETLLYRKR